MAVVVFFLFVGFVLGMSFYLAKRGDSSATGFFAAGGRIPWPVNGLAFAGDYLSAASFLGICGMIAVLGYDGFLYSIGYLAGWIVALFVIAEPMKRLGKYTFTDALDAKFDSQGIKLAAAISTLIVSVFYLIPQMVGAGALVTPLLGLPHWVGVVLVGVVVIIIVVTAGMTSTTWVQFIKGGLLIILSTALVISLSLRGLETDAPGADRDGEPHAFPTVSVERVDGWLQADGEPVKAEYAVGANTFARVDAEGQATWWLLVDDGETPLLRMVQWRDANGYNGDPSLVGPPYSVSYLVSIQGRTGPEASTGAISPLGMLAILDSDGTVVETWRNVRIPEEATTVYYPVLRPTKELMIPGEKFKTETGTQKLNFMSLMLALFLGTASLPHILIRYYTVSSPAAARKSTIVAIAAIGFFYVLTMFMGYGAMVNGAMNPASNNMAAPLLAGTFGELFLAVISALAFATILGTVSGLIVASSGAVAHDLFDRYGLFQMTEKRTVLAAKLSAVAVGVIAIVLGVFFQGTNVSFLVGWAFAVAASANFPAIIMILFWKPTTAKGVVASIVVGIVAALGIILTGPGMFKVYGLNEIDAWHQLGQPGIISIPLSFLSLVVVSLITRRDNDALASGSDESTAIPAAAS
jgi:cation/acetate symporter